MPRLLAPSAAAGVLLAALVASSSSSLARAAPPRFSWETLPTFVHCSNASGPLNDEIIALMASSGFAVIEKYQALEADPPYTGGEEKVIAAARAVRAVNPNATLIFYFAVDYARTWYDLGRFFVAHPSLEVHNADGSLARVASNDFGDNNWTVFDYAQDGARSAWVQRIADVVFTADQNGNNLFDGCFVDGYRPGNWADQLIPSASDDEKIAWAAGANLTGFLLRDALGANSSIRIINPGQTIYEWGGGYNAASIEFLDGSETSVSFLRQLAASGTFVEAHTYAGSDVGKFNISLAAFLVGAGENAYFGAGSEWSACDDWLIPHAEYAKPLGAPDGDAQQNGTVYTRTFGSGKVSVTLDTAKQAGCVRWGDGSTTGNAC
jgi:hypothetical protein